MAVIPSGASLRASAAEGPLWCVVLPGTTPAFRSGKRRQLLASLFCILLLTLGSYSVAQAPPKTQPTPPAPQQPPAQATPEHHITPEEAKELLSAVDEVLKFDSSDTGLPIKHEVKRQLASREQVQKYVEDRIKEDEDAQRLRRSEAVLKKLGLLPRDFNLESFLVQLLREQVAGYYDSKTKTVYLLDWLSPATQLPVLAHELTHALQDQNFGLEKWIGKGTSGKTPAQEVRADEEIAARHAVVEGQAMAAMIDYLLAPTGGSVVKNPLVTEAIQQGMMEGGDSPIFNRAPLFLKRVLLFPYRYGLDFERELLAKGGKEKAFAGVFKSPPQNTRQVMEPATYLSGEKLPDMPVPEIAKLLGKDWEKYDVGSIGEFDIAVMAEIYADPDTAIKIYPKWRGGWYYAAETKQSHELALVMVTRWENPAAAAAFQTLYAGTVPKRYKVDPGVPGGGAGGIGASPTVSTLSTHWNTSDGPVELVTAGDMVVAIESVPADMVDKLRQAVLGK
jgi:hypothetical protein